jgi:hypothetical protein
MKEYERQFYRWVAEILGLIECLIGVLTFAYIRHTWKIDFTTWFIFKSIEEANTSVLVIDSLSQISKENENDRNRS